jgi:hypothetical protein
MTPAQDQSTASSPSLASVTTTFAPPVGCRFEPEFEPPAPRRIPGELLQGRHAKRQRRTTVGLAVARALCLGLSQLSIVRSWGLYFLPLNYLSWIGLGLLVWPAWFA